MGGNLYFDELNPLFRQAVSAIDAGDAKGLERLLDDHPELMRERAECGEGYFRMPYLLWFAAENPIRTGRMPGNVIEVVRVMICAAKRRSVESLQDQLDYMLMLVSSGMVARECGAQLGLIDELAGAGADPSGALMPALAHRELAAAERLLKYGAPLTLTAAVCTGRMEEMKRLGPGAGPDDKRTALAAAALYGDAEALAFVIGLGVSLNDYSPEGFHPHATALHQAVNSGSLEAVQLLVESGADSHIKDTGFQSTPLGWADHMERTEIAEYLRGRM